eukprot:gb/GEZJ01007116.1/.p1 GENE.gb/GEZJ01007116.1/~~gb/GEZJ01007116.1/.p1  ORF type:complete len:135 (-),score=13.11 gb/GEZJ01007116.1/:306-710(-)
MFEAHRQIRAVIWEGDVQVEGSTMRLRSKAKAISSTPVLRYDWGDCLTIGEAQLIEMDGYEEVMCILLFDVKFTFALVCCNDDGEEIFDANVSEIARYMHFERLAFRMMLGEELVIVLGMVGKNNTCWLTGFVF